MRRAFEHDLPAADLPVSETEYRIRIRAVSHSLRPALQNAIMFIGKSLGV